MTKPEPPIKAIAKTLKEAATSTQFERLRIAMDSLNIEPGVGKDPMQVVDAHDPH